MNRISLSGKLLLLGLVASVFAAISGVASIATLSKTEKIYKNLVEDAQAKTLLLAKLLGDFRETRIQIRSLALRDLSAEEAVGYASRTKTQVGFVLASLEQFTKVANDDQDKAIQADLLKAWSAFYAVGGKILEAYGDDLSKNPKELSRLIREACPPAAAKVQEALDRALERQRVVVDELLENANRSAAFGRNLATALAAIASVVGLLAAYLLARALSRGIMAPVARMESSSQALAQDASALLEVNGHLDRMIKRQAEELESAGDSARKLNEAVNRSERAASESKALSIEGAKAVSEGTEAFGEAQIQMRGAVEAMEALSQNLSSTSEEMRTLVSLFEKVSDKTQVIADIVFQTRLLSFNASVEAARAGEHGKGFAVVAEEVGRLATMSGAAAREIDALLSDSRKHVGELVSHNQSRVDESRGRVDKVVRSIETASSECLAAFERIQTKVAAMTEAIDSIAESSREQASGLAAIGANVENLCESAVQGRSKADETLSISLSLEGQAKTLRSAVVSLNSVVSGESARRAG